MWRKAEPPSGGVRTLVSPDNGEPTPDCETTMCPGSRALVDTGDLSHLAARSVVFQSSYRIGQSYVGLEDPQVSRPSAAQPFISGFGQDGLFDLPGPSVDSRVKKITSWRAGGYVVACPFVFVGQPSTGVSFFEGLFCEPGCQNRLDELFD